MEIRPSCVYFFFSGLIILVSTESAFGKAQTARNTNDNDRLTNGDQSQNNESGTQSLQRRGGGYINNWNGITTLGDFSIDEIFDDFNQRKGSPSSGQTGSRKTRKRADQRKRAAARAGQSYPSRSPAQSAQMPRSRSLRRSTSSRSPRRSTPTMIQHSAQISNIQDENGQQMAYDHNRLHIRMRSPKTNINVSVRDNKVYVNNRIVCTDESKLTDELTYQKCADGAFWHTNLKVGKPMTEKEIQAFEREFKLAEETSQETAAYWQKYGEDQKAYWKDWAKNFKRSFSGGFF